MNKIVNIIKPTGMTSHDVVSAVRKILNTKKVGHTGTLDPDASGVLPICIGKATKVSELILNKDKSYICELTFGITTDTYDSSGEILERVDNFSFTKEEIEKAFDTQRGHIDQLPPMYSALKVNGKRMCDLVRSGRADEINLKCSKGTYVRSICYDVGKVLGCGGHMSFLLRTSSGKFNLENGITLEELKEYNDNNTLDKYLYDIDYVLTNFNKIKIHENAEKYYINGGIIDERRFIEKDFNENDEFVRVYSSKEFIGIGKIIRKNNTISVKSDKLFIV